MTRTVILRHVVIFGVLAIALPLGVPGLIRMMWRQSHV